MIDIAEKSQKAKTSYFSSKQLLTFDYISNFRIRFMKKCTLFLIDYDVLTQ